jgi:phosphatidylglycerophosphate synthase
MRALVAAYRDLLRSYYGQGKERKEMPFLLYRYLYRPLSFPVSAVAIRVGVTADAMTAMNLLVLIAALVALSWGSASALLLGAWLYLGYFILDFADGNVARYHGTSSFFGKLIDGMVDSVSFLIFAAVGWGSARADGAWFGAQTEVLLGVATTIAALLRQNYQWRVVALKAEVRLSEVAGREAAASPPMRRVVWLFNNAACSAPLLLLGAAYLEAVSLFLLVFFVLYGIGGSCEILLGVIKNRSALRARREH